MIFDVVVVVRRRMAGMQRYSACARISAEKLDVLKRNITSHPYVHIFMLSLIIISNNIIIFCLYSTFDIF